MCVTITLRLVGTTLQNLTRRREARQAW